MDNYKILLKVKPKHLKTAYPYISMDKDTTATTINKISIIANSSHNNGKMSGGYDRNIQKNKILVVTL
jgi:hypothetical protein